MNVEMASADRVVPDPAAVPLAAKVTGMVFSDPTRIAKRVPEANLEQSRAAEERKREATKAPSAADRARESEVAADRERMTSEQFEKRGQQALFELRVMLPRFILVLTQRDTNKHQERKKGGVVFLSSLSL